MRKIALLVALFTAIAGGAAAFAAPDTGPATPGPAPDPYLGTWALTIDGVLAGPVATVDGCSLAGEVVTEAPGPDGKARKHLARGVADPCMIEVGLGMSKSFYAWMSRSLSGAEVRRSMQLVRVDGKAYAFELTGAALQSLTVPKLDRASAGPAFLKLSLSTQAIRRTPAPALPKEAALPSLAIAPAALDLKLAGVSLDPTSVGPWTAKVSEATTTGNSRDYGAPAFAPAEVGDLPLRVPELSKLAPVATLDGWLQAFMTGPKISDDERPVVLGLTDGKARVEIAFDRAGPAKGDLAPRADGNRSYVLYAEGVAVYGG